MKNKHYVVTSEMKKRIKDEMKLNGEKNTDISELLSIEPQSFSRILNGNSRLADDYLSVLCKHWGVRKEYLLCMDSIRTESDMFDNEIDEQYDRTKKLIDFLGAMGYEVDSMHMLIISPADIVAYGSYCTVGELIELVIHYAYGAAEKIERFIDAARDMAVTDYGYYKKHWFNISPDIIPKLYELEKNGKLTNDCMDFWLDCLHRCYRISKRGVVLGYLERTSFLEITDILERNTENLFASLLDAFFYQNGAGVYADNGQRLALICQ